MKSSFDFWKRHELRIIPQKGTFTDRQTAVSGQIPFFLTTIACIVLIKRCKARAIGNSIAVKPCGSVDTLKALFYQYLIRATKLFGPGFFILVAKGVATGYFMFSSKRQSISRDFYAVLFPAKSRTYHYYATWK
jgi:hypothetical protein